MILYCVGTVELANDGADCVEKMAGLSNSSNAPSMGNYEPEDNVSSLRKNGFQGSIGKQFREVQHSNSKSTKKAIIKCIINEVRPVTLGSTHGDCEKYKYSFFGSTIFA
jgi:hypothetical protein